MSPALSKVYDNLANLRAALTSDNVDRRTDAYEAVLSNDIQPKDVLGESPPEQALRDAGVLPPSDEAASRADREQQIIKLLEQIVENTGGGS